MSVRSSCGTSRAKPCVTSIIIGLEDITILRLSPSLSTDRIPATRAEHMKLMMDILVLALWSDTTRISAFMTADAQTNEDFSFLAGVKGGMHSLSHHAEEPGRKGQSEA